MGNSQAYRYADCVVKGWITLDAALRQHLKENHFPPIPTYMVEPAKKAISLIREGLHNERVPLPPGVNSQTYGDRVPAHAVADDLNLWPFIGYFDDVDYWEPVPGSGEITAHDIGAVTYYVMGQSEEGDEPDLDNIREILSQLEVDIDSEAELADFIRWVKTEPEEVAVKIVKEQKEQEERERNYCPSCGVHFFAHDSDGSCVEED